MNVAEVAAPTVERVGSPLPQAWRRSGLLTVSALVALTVVGAVLRVAVAHQSLYADELATYWLITTHGFRGVISALYSTHDEITPPLSFLAFWVTAHLGHSPELVRLPSLLAGILTIPLVYLVGLRTIGRAGALVAAALTAFSPFMIYYSTEARAYGLMMFLVTLSTLAMLTAVDTRRARWWVLYGVCSCAAFYTHYTSMFVLAIQFLWLVWRHPEARRRAVLANICAIAAVLPWTGGLINDFNSPTTKILSALSPFTARAVGLDLEGWALGYPYITSVDLTELPGTFAIVLLCCGVLAASLGIATRSLREGARSTLARVDDRVLLVIALALATPLGEAIFSLISTHLFGVRNLASSWPPFALSLAALLVSAGPRLRFVAVALAVGSFVIGAAKMLDEKYQRPNYGAPAALIARQARPGDVVIDETGVISPGPLTPLDVALHRPIDVVRAGAPVERDHPFGFFDPIVPLQDAIREAVGAARGARIFVVVYPSHQVKAFRERATLVRLGSFPAGYRRVAVRVYPGIVDTVFAVYAERTRSS